MLVWDPRLFLLELHIWLALRDPRPSLDFYKFCSRSGELWRNDRLYTGSERNLFVLHGSRLHRFGAMSDWYINYDKLTGHPPMLVSCSPTLCMLIFKIKVESLSLIFWENCTFRTNILDNDRIIGRWPRSNPIFY